MQISELQNKEIINLIDGRNLGNIVDLDIEVGTGQIIGVVVAKANFLGFLSKQEDYFIKWEEIEKIGTDLLFVNQARFVEI